MLGDFNLNLKSSGAGSPYIEDSIFIEDNGKSQELITTQQNLTTLKNPTKDAVFYLTDATENEEYAFMKLLDQYDWTEEELKQAIDHGFRERALYMRTFTFDVINTKLRSLSL